MKPPSPSGPDAGGRHVIRKLDLSDRQEVSKVLDLQKSAYAVEAELIGFSEIPPLKDTAETLQDCGETFYGYFAEGGLVGAVSFKQTDNVLDIHRLAVHPDHFRRGIGRALVAHAEGVAGDVDRIIVSTGNRNMAAKLLYRNLGFRETGESEPVKGMWITSFEKPLGSNDPDSRRAAETAPE